MPAPIQLYCLVGPTAAGKTEVAHRLAERLDLPVLSADSMMVYRGMDIGTAKPTPAERRAFRYHGLDLADPAQPFSVAAYRRAVAASLRAAGVTRAILCGGTGLYVKALLHGLREGPQPDPAERAALEALFASGGLPALRARLEEMGAWDTVPPGDHANPRRLLRALERAAHPAPPAAPPARPAPVLAGLGLDRAWLATRIESRVRAMYAQGLVDEAASVLGNLPAADTTLAPTAPQAIGYAEALAVRAGRLRPADAIALTATRTRQYAKRQETWFRRQERVEWVARTPASTLDGLADAVAAVWDRHGPAGFDTGDAAG